MGLTNTYANQFVSSGFPINLLSYLAQSQSAQALQGVSAQVGQGVSEGEEALGTRPNGLGGGAAGALGALGAGGGLGASGRGRALSPHGGRGDRCGGADGWPDGPAGGRDAAGHVADTGAARFGGNATRHE